MAAIRRTPRPLGLLLLLGTLHLVAWNVAVPAFQGPDEDAHFAYVQYVGETASLPSATTGPTPQSTEQGSTLNWLNLNPLRGIRDARPAWSSADLSSWRQLESTLPAGSRSNGSGPNPQAKNPPLYYAAMAVPYKAMSQLPLLKRLFVLRLFNLPFYLAAIVFTWLIAGELFGRVRWKQTLAAGAVTLQPQLAFMAAIINADIALTAFCTAFLYTALRLVRVGPSPRLVLAASGLAAAATLTHGRGLVTLPVLIVALAATWVRHRPCPRETVITATTALGTILGALLVYLAFGRGRGGGLYGGQVTALNSGATFSVRQFLSFIYQFYFPALPGMQPRIGPPFGYRQVFIETFYGTFGWLEVTFKAWVYAALQVVSAIGLVSVYTTCVMRWRTLLRAWPQVIVVVTMLFTSVLFLHYVSYRALLTNQATDPLIVGRYLLPIISLFGIAVAFVIGALPRRAGHLAAAVVLAAGVLLSLSGIGITFVRFYA